MRIRKTSFSRKSYKINLKQVKKGFKGNNFEEFDSGKFLPVLA